MRRTFNRLNELSDYTIGSANAKAEQKGRYSQAGNIIQTRIDEINNKYAFDVYDVFSDYDSWNFRLKRNIQDGLCYILVEDLANGGKDFYTADDIDNCFRNTKTEENKYIYIIVRNLKAGPREKLHRMALACLQINSGIKNMRGKLSENKLRKVIKECVEQELRKLYRK